MSELQRDILDSIVSVMCDAGMKCLRTYGTELSKEGVAVGDAGAR
jgi:hypothetical protein